MSAPSSSRKRSSPDINIQGGSSVAEDERKLKRRLTNTESARRSRDRKQQELADALADATHFKAQKTRAEAQISAYKANLAKAEAENVVLRAQNGELAGQLQAVEAVLELFQVAGPAAVDIIPKIPVDPPLCPSQSTFAQQLAAATAMADAFPF